MVERQSKISRLSPNSKAGDISRALGGRRDGTGFRAPCPIHGGRSLCLDDAPSGKVLLQCWFGCERLSVIGKLRELGLWGATARSSELPRTFPKPVTTVVDNSRRTELALKLWGEAIPAAGTLVGTYLRSRGIVTTPPPSLRFQARLKHPSGAYLPAMIALVQDVNGKPVAIHRTYLRPDGNGKANVEPQKMMLGPCRGAAVRLSETGTLVLAIAEGIETALSVAQANPALTVWAALSTSGMKALALPAETRDVLIYADNDDSRAGLRAAYAASDRFVREGRRVWVALPERPGDFNDLLLRPGGDGVVAEDGYGQDS